MPEEKIEVTAVVNCHHEGLLVWKSLLSAVKAVQSFTGRGEVLIVVDDGDEATICAVDSFAKTHSSACEIRIHLTMRRDLGLARNDAVWAARGEFVAFLDGDDIWGPSWLERGVAWLRGEPGATVAHCQTIVNFGTDRAWWQHTDSRDPAFDHSVFMVTNHWTALSMARRELYISHPYHAVGNGYGFEDWEWNTRTLAAGVVHGVVPCTVHFVRKGRGMSMSHAMEWRVPRPNAYYDDLPPALIGEPVQSPRELGEWLNAEWMRAHDSEPELWPHPRELASRPQYRPPSIPGTYAAYRKLRAVVAPETTHAIFAAGLGGGADLRAAIYSAAIKRAGGTPFVVTTDAPGPLRCDWADASKAFSMLSEDQRALVVQRLMLQLADQGVALHVVNSRVAWQALAMNPRISALRGRVWASLYAYELHPEDMTGGYAANGAFGAAMPAVRRVITDNLNFKLELAIRTGWEATALALTPVTLREPKHAPRVEGVRRVLWASRLDWNKNPQLLFEIASQALAQGAPLVFDVAGDSVDYHGQAAIQQLRALPNVRLLGFYRDFEDLEPWKYDAFLFTSRKEGMPNVVLEAVAWGLPIVATPAGMLNGVYEGTIFPQNVIITASSAVELLKKVEKTPTLREYVAKHHSIEAFDTVLREAGYLD